MGDNLREINHRKNWVPNRVKSCWLTNLTHQRVICISLIDENSLVRGCSFHPTKNSEREETHMMHMPRTCTCWWFFVDSTTMHVGQSLKSCIISTLPQSPQSPLPPPTRPVHRHYICIYGGYTVLQYMPQYVKTSLGIRIMKAILTSYNCHCNDRLKWLQTVLWCSNLNSWFEWCICIICQYHARLIPVSFQSHVLFIPFSWHSLALLLPVPYHSPDIHVSVPKAGFRECHGTVGGVVREWRGKEWDWQGNGAGKSVIGRGMARERAWLAGEWPGKERDWQGNGM